MFHPSHIATISHGQSDHNGASLFGTPLKAGRLISMVVKQFILNKPTGEEQTVIAVKGVPASHTARAYQASITFLQKGLSLPKPVFDESVGHIRLYYPYEEMQSVMKVLKSPTNRMCYLWQANDGKRALAWLLAL